MNYIGTFIFSPYIPKVYFEVRFSLIIHTMTSHTKIDTYAVLNSEVDCQVYDLPALNPSQKINSHIG
jgi:hypothetical protein